MVRYRNRKNNIMREWMCRFWDILCIFRRLLLQIKTKGSLLKFTL